VGLASHVLWANTPLGVWLYVPTAQLQTLTLNSVNAKQGRRGMVFLHAIHATLVHTRLLLEVRPAPTAPNFLLPEIHARHQSLNANAARIGLLVAELFSPDMLAVTAALAHNAIPRVLTVPPTCTKQMDPFRVFHAPPIRRLLPAV